MELLLRLARCGRACTVSELNKCCPVDISVVSRHLSALRDAGIVVSEKRGKEVYYRVCCAEVVESLRRIADALECCCASAKQSKESSK